MPRPGGRLSHNAQITRVAWVDDDLDQDAWPGRDRPTVSRAQLCVEERQRRNLEAMAIAPATDYGMTPRHVTDLERWIGQRA